MPGFIIALRPAFVFIAALSLCACSAGGALVTATALPSPDPTPSPPPPAVVAGAAFTSAPASVPVVANVPLSLPYGGDFPAAPTMVLPAPASPFPAGANFSVVASSAMPDDVPALARARAAASLRATQSLPATPLLVLRFVSNVDVALTSAPAFRFALPRRAIVPGVQYWLALFDLSRSGLGWQYGLEGPGTLAGSTVAFAGGTPLRFPAGSRMIVVLYALPNGITPPTPAPLPSPSVTPSATPTPVSNPGPGAVLLGTTAMTFTRSGAIQTSSIAQANGTGSYTVTSSNPNVAAAFVRGSLVTVLSGASGGATIAVTGAGGQKAAIAVVVNLPGSPTFSQPALAFNGPGETMTSTVTQAGYAGPFTAVSTNPGVATATVSGSTVTVTSVAPGTTTIGVGGANGRRASIAVTVTTFTIGVH